MNRTPIHVDPRSTWELINVALASEDEDAADSTYWSAMTELHSRGTPEGFEAAKSLCESPCPFEQRIGCNILAQLGGVEMPFASESFPLVVSVVRKTDNVNTLGCALCALGWLHDLRGVSYVIPFLNHSDSDIRYWVTHALTALHDDERSIDGLIRLSTDSSVDVRDWATFGLGSMTERDTPSIRQALIARLDDPDITVRGEALVGLARRQDERVVEPLRQAFESGVYKNGISDFAAEALEALNTLEKYPQLAIWKNNV